MKFISVYGIIAFIRLYIKNNGICGDDDRACAIGGREPCQMGNQAAISGFFDVLRITRSEPFLKTYAPCRVAFFSDILSGKERRQVAYQAIYRKWRPMVFEDIVGQGHVTSTLKNQITSGRIGHAYLFCGTRGTGKTTAAKVFARAVNCINNKDGSPCNECEICRGLLDGSILDVTEIDAASNNGVDNIRELREDTKYATAAAKYRVYIIDEVHMLSGGAFNALLKTLEEPPEHVIFILATTEAHKVPQTILSRCQRFDFKRIRQADITARLKEIAYGDGLKLTDDAYAMIARLADGSMRDGLSVLERVVSSCGSEITAKDITDTLGIAALDTEFELAEALIEKNAERVFLALGGVVDQGRDLNVFIDSVITHFRNLLVCRLTENSKELLDYSDEEIVRFKAQAERAGFERISNVIKVLTEAKADAKWLKSPRVVYELALVKLCEPELDSSADAVLDRLSTVEEKIKNGIEIRTAAQPAEEKKEPPKKEKTVSARLFNPIPQDKLNSENPIVIAAKKWDRIAASITKANPHLLVALTERPITIDNDGIIMIFDRKTEGMSKNIAERFSGTVESGFRKASGLDCRIKTAFRDEIEDFIIDFWALKAPEGAEQPKPEASGNADPLERVSEEFAELINFTDDSEFLDYKEEENNFSQSDFDDEDDDREEFLDSDELSDGEEEE